MQDAGLLTTSYSQNYTPPWSCTYPIMPQQGLGLRVKGALWLADMPGALPNRLVRSRLSSLLAPEVKDAYLAYLRTRKSKCVFLPPIQQPCDFPCVVRKGGSKHTAQLDPSALSVRDTHDRHA